MLSFPRLVLIPVAFVALACSTIERLGVSLPPEVLPADLNGSPTPIATAGEDPVSTLAPPTGDLSAGVLAQMNEIEAQVVALRGLQPTAPVIRMLLTPEELRQHVLNDFLQDYSAADASEDVIELSLLGLLEADYDLWNLYLELYAEQISGFYDATAQTLYVVRGAGFAGLERLTYAHEFVHALQDQAYDLDEGLGYNETACRADSERCAGLQSLIEGDATLLEEQWLRTYATPSDLDELRDFYDAYQSPVFDSTPAFLQQDFLFPYNFGLEFVRNLYLDGGWAGVDRAYAAPPSSTEQILHPDRYPGDSPARLEIPDLAAALGSSWKEIERNVFGEWYLRLVLEKVLPPEDAASSAAGWEGDAYVVMADGASHGALVLVTAWDGVGQAQAAFVSLRAYGDVRFGPAPAQAGQAEWQGSFGVVRLERRSDQTLWILAPESAVADALRAGVLFPAPRP